MMAATSPASAPSPGYPESYGVPRRRQPFGDEPANQLIRLDEDDCRGAASARGRSGCFAGHVAIFVVSHWSLVSFLFQL